MARSRYCCVDSRVAGGNGWGLTGTTRGALEAREVGLHSYALTVGMNLTDGDVRL